MTPIDELCQSATNEDPTDDSEGTRSQSLGERSKGGSKGVSAAKVSGTFSLT